MKTNYSDIVDVKSIGAQVNPILMNDLLKKADEEEMCPGRSNKEQVLFIGIDVQQDFMDDGALGVPGAKGDVERMTQFIYKNADKISNITVTLDTHTPYQIFHPCWWIDENGNNPAPYTLITLADLDAGKWRAVVSPAKSRDYVMNLEKGGKKTLCIWPYHCIKGTMGHALDNQFANMVYFHSVVKKYRTQIIVKGEDPLSEMYGFLRPEYDLRGYVNVDFLNKMETFDKIVIAGEAQSHCVLESINQIVENYDTRPEITKKIYILEDCMSCIQGYEDATQQAFDEIRNKYKVNIVKSTDDFLD